MTDIVQLYSTEAEQSVLGALMLDNQAWEKVCDILTPEMFFDRAHQIIAKVLFDSLDNGKAVDFVIASSILQSNGTLQDVGEIGYLVSLVQNTPSSANIVRYAEVVRAKYIARGAIHVAGEMIGELQEPKGRKPEEIVGAAAAEMERLTEEKDASVSELDAVQMAELFLQTITRRYELPDGHFDGVETGYSDLDAVLKGMRGGDLVIIAGRPGMGKTVMMMDIATHVACNQGNAFVFSMEMQPEQMADRLGAALSSVPLDRIRSGDIQDGDWDMLPAYLQKARDRMKMWIDFRPALRTSQIRNKCRIWRRKHGKPAAIFIDYIGLAKTDRVIENKVLEIAEISAAFKALAKEMGCPVIALSQLSRKVEERADKRPMMSDLRDSGAIEQDADIVLFPYRDEYYNKDSRFAGIAEINFGKFRQGEAKPVYLKWQGENSRMRDLEKGWIPPAESMEEKPKQRRGFY